MTDPRQMEPFPRFSDVEMARRREAMETLMADAGVAHLVLYGAEKSGSAVPWLTGWQVTREAAVLVTPGERDVLLVQHYNHLPNARRVAKDADVDWGGPSTLDTLGELLDSRDSASAAVGVVGPLSHRGHLQLAEHAASLVELGAEYTRLRLVKSEEELDWLRLAAELSDRAIAAIADNARPGIAERELAAAIEATFLPEGAVNHLHYIASSPMDDPDMCVPAQVQSTRRLEAGDVVFAEISAAFWGYAGQVLRTYTIASDPMPLFTNLHETADAAFDAITSVIRPGVHARELVEASSVIEESGYTIYDDLVHGYGGGYLPPVLGDKTRAHRPIPDITLEEGMCLVVQPNVITPDESAGVQTGELGVVTEDGFQSLHHTPRGMHRLG